ncbi:MAG TPA: Gfo/Idh/MocA family oxidoreductase [Devosiaceae bacterium]|jgi:UDP-N-acetyl-2-amino-2-deoxyglucuronate dehydrogenase
MPAPFGPIKDRKIRVALVGCGRISQNHFAALGQYADDIELVDVCDVIPAAAQAAAQKTGARAHTNYTEMLRQSDADVVVLTTPSGLHASQGILAAGAGKHVVSEKPMATKLEDGVEFVKACDTAGVKLFVVKQNRRNSTLQLLKRAVTQGRFGRINMVTLNVFWTRPQDYYDAAKWRGTWEYDGGAFMNQASHYVDLLNWLVGPIESLHAYTATLGRKIEAEDTGVLSVKWRSGALGSMAVTMLTYPKNLEGSVTILGDKGTVRVGGIALNQIEAWEFAEPHEDDAKVADASYIPNSVYGAGHALYYDNVVKTLRGEAEAETDGREGLKSLEVLIATYRSARDGQRVALPLRL